jgi:hypothetical protein
MFIGVGCSVMTVLPEDGVDACFARNHLDLAAANVSSMQQPATGNTAADRAT